MKQSEVICSPEQYWGSAMQQHIAASIIDPGNQWIYNIEHSQDECILMETEHVVLCRDKSPSSDERFLIIFRDDSLKSMRDLRGEHIKLLEHVARTIKNFQRLNLINGPWSAYFNYLPSTFQLHLHLARQVTGKIHMRAHNLFRVLNNLRRDPQYYENALILTRCEIGSPLHAIYEETKQAQTPKTETDTNAEAGSI